MKVYAKMFLISNKLQYFNLIFKQIFEFISFSDEVRFSVQEHHFCRFQSRIEIGTHLKTISARISENQNITFPYLIYFSIPSKSICFTDVSDNRINSFCTFWIR